MQRLAKLMVCLAVSLLVVCGMPTMAFATTGSQDGLTVEIVTDKETYSANEEISVEIIVTNTNDFDLEQVTIESLLPEGFTVKSGTLQQESIDLKVGATVSLSAVLVQESPASPATPETQATPAAPGNSENKAQTTSKLPDTSDSSNWFLWVMLAGISALGIFFAIKFKKNATKATSVAVSVALVVGTLGVINLSAFAENEAKSFQTIHTISVGGQACPIKVNASYVIASESSPNQEEEDDGDFDPIYSVTDIKKVDGLLQFEVGSGENSYLVVELLADVSADIISGFSTDWKSGHPLGAGRVQVAGGTEKEFVDISISGTIPENFVAVAYLEDENGNRLCDEALFLEFTDSYAQYMAQTVNDFDPDLVVNLDDNPDTNFMVINEDTLKVISGENDQNVLTVKSPNNYVLSNASPEVLSLNAGDQVVVVCGNDIFLINVVSINVSNGDVEIVAAEDYDLEDFFNLIKIVVDDFDDFVWELDMSEADEGVEYWGEADLVDYDELSQEINDLVASQEQNEENEVDTLSVHEGFAKAIEADLGAASASVDIAPLADIEAEISASAGGSFKIVVPVSDNVDCVGSAAFKFKVAVKIIYDIRLFSADYFEFKFSTTTETTYALSLKANLPQDVKDKLKKEIKLGAVSFPVGSIPGLAAKVELKIPLEWEISGGVSVTKKDTTEKGFKYSSTSGYQNIDKKESKTTLEVSGELKITFGPKAEFKLTFLDKVIEAGIGVHAGVELKASIKIPSGHKCFTCVEGKSTMFLKANLFLKYNIFDILKGTPVDITLGEFRATIPGIGEFYYSMSNPADSMFNGQKRFGFGSCPNKDENGKLKGSVKDAETNLPIRAAKVVIHKGLTKTEIKTDNSGNYEISLSPGEYRIVVEAPNYKPFESTEIVESNRETFLPIYLMVTNQSGNGTATGTLKNAIDGNALADVTLEVRNGWNNTSGSIVGTYKTDSSGKYSISLPYGNYTMCASLNGYVTNCINIVVSRTTLVKNGTLNPVAGDDVYRIVLTWGELPYDLDSHLRAKNIHVYYADDYSANAWLDVDDRYSYGPETITIENFAALGGFNYSVHNFSDRNSTSNADRLSGSGAQVRVYKGSSLLRTYNVPTGKSGTVWNVFSMNANGSITDLNTFGYESNASLVGYGLRIPGSSVTPSAFEMVALAATSNPNENLKDYELDNAA